MSREAELIKEINEHIKKAGGLYGLVKASATSG